MNNDSVAQHLKKVEDVILCATLAIIFPPVQVCFGVGMHTVVATVSGCDQATQEAAGRRRMPTGKNITPLRRTSKGQPLFFPFRL